jgi:hypothetical protein
MLFIGTTEFIVNKDTGEVSLATGTLLNQTSSPSYRLTVIAADGGTPALSSTVDVTVNIITGM